MILITHDLGVVAGVADRVLVMYAGKPVEIGSVDDIYYRPRMPYTARAARQPAAPGRGDQDRLTPIAGAPPSLVNLPPGCPFAPRCPMHRALCDQNEPELLLTDTADHFAACHFSDELIGTDATDVLRRDSRRSDSGAPGRRSEGDRT